MVAGKVTDVIPGPRGSATVEVALIKAYKPGKLKISKVGQTATIKLNTTCKRSPGLTKGMTIIRVVNLISFALLPAKEDPC